MKKHITALLLVLFINAFLLASCTEIETDSSVPGNMVSETIIETVETVTVPQTNISDVETIFETGKETTEKPFVWVTNEEKVKYLMPNIEYRGDEYWCSHYDFTWGVAHFHSVPSILLDYFNLEKDDVWKKFKEAMKENIHKAQLEDCDGWSIYDVIHWFKIPRDELEYIYYNSALMYSMDWNFDVLYANDIKAADQYYNYKNNYSKLVYRSSLDNEYWKKLRLRELVEKKGDKEKLNKVFNEHIQKIQYLTYDKSPYIHDNFKHLLLSIPEYIYTFNITREEFEAAFRDDGGFVFTYDLDRIYNQKDELMKQISEAKTLLDIYNIDASLRLDG